MKVNQVLLGLLLFAGIVFLGAGTVAVIHLDGLIVRQDIMLQNTEKNLNARLDHLDDVLTKLGTNSDDLSGVLKETRHTVRSANRVVAKSEQSVVKLNGVLDTAQATFTEQQQYWAQSGKQMVDWNRDIRLNLAHLNRVTLPALDGDLKELGERLKEAKQFQSNMNQASENIASTTHSIDVAVKRWTKPSSWLKSLGMGLLGISRDVKVLVK